MISDKMRLFSKFQYLTFLNAGSCYSQECLKIRNVRFDFTEVCVIGLSVLQ